MRLIVTDQIGAAGCLSMSTVLCLVLQVLAGCSLIDTCLHSLAG